VIFLARHGDAHTIPPHQVNYRANLWALKEQGAREIVSVVSVGGIREDLGPGKIVVPHQIIDSTWGRAHTYFDDGAPVKHIDFTEPYSGALRAQLLGAAKKSGEEAVDGAVYAATQGPRLETAAEIDRLEKEGADIVGMTGIARSEPGARDRPCLCAVAAVVNTPPGGATAREAYRCSGSTRSSSIRWARAQDH